MQRKNMAQQNKLIRASILFALAELLDDPDIYEQIAGNAENLSEEEFRIAEIKILSWINNHRRAGTWPCIGKQGQSQFH